MVKLFATAALALYATGVHAQMRGGRPVVPAESAIPAVQDPVLPAPTAPVAPVVAPVAPVVLPESATLAPTVDTPPGTALAVPAQPSAAAAAAGGTSASASVNASANANANGNANANANANATANAPLGKGTNPLVIKGTRFFDSVTGEYFGMRGVNYYPRPNTGTLDLNNLDFFTKEFAHVWGRDVPQFVALGANAIRLYAVDPDPAADHTDFMCALQSAGIYVIVDLGSSCPGCEITPDAAPDCYPASYKKRGEQIIAKFSQYDNVIAFSGGNEINHRTAGFGPERNAACQKKFVRDMRAYIKSCPSMRQIPMGLVVADTHREENAKYYNCLTDPTDELEHAEWYGLNTYVHCEDIADPDMANGFNLLRDDFESYKYSIPTVLTEFGCLSPSFPTINGSEAQRTFHDAMFMNQAPYTEYFNGGFVFEYSTENANSKSTSPYPFSTFGAQNYGLGYLSPEDCDEVDNDCEFVRFPTFYKLAEQYKATDTSREPTLTKYTPDPTRLARSECPALFPKLSEFVWEGDSTKREACPTTLRYQCPAVPLASAKVRNADQEEDTTDSSSADIDAQLDSQLDLDDPILEDDGADDHGSGADRKATKGSAGSLAPVTLIAAATTVLSTAWMLL